MDSAADGLRKMLTQTAFAELVGIGQPAVSDLMRRGVISSGDTADRWLKQYCAHLREQAAGRAAAGELDLAAERAALAREQRDRIAMQNAVTRRELAPVATLEMALATMGRKVGAALEAIPVNIKRRSKNLTAEDIEIITGEINRARNIAAAAQLEEDDGHVGDSEGDPPGAEEP
jgi:phage terminase Nu1 subunit (DNA packaging protein)